MGAVSSTKVLRVSPQQKRRQQVAAVCYRMGRRGVEFLLVQTRGGRWIFPKGGVEAGLTLAQSAALEALEEAGVHGRIEEIPFGRYFRSAPDAGVSEPAVATYLCEVTRREAPQEANRNPTWFSAEKAKQRLRQDRAREFGEELARIVDRASSRIERLRNGCGSEAWQRKDELQRVRFDYFDVARFYDGRRFPSMGAAEGIGRRVLRLGAGTTSSGDRARNVTAIDAGMVRVSPGCENVNHKGHDGPRRK
ncbi:MAG TPA: NUDIX domain-containing protein [Terriglobales bacterium]|jgi:8-oxo-dGTP pyrophosphatase MutT (NUDIX family)|nr:NUDIX domain-containing protein [Terriglobales bacterium]